MSLADELDALLSEDPAGVREREACTLDRILSECAGRCVLFGAGSLGRTALRCLLRDGIRPQAITDNNPAIWNTQIEGIPVVSPAEAAALYGSNAAFFVTIWTTGHRYAETYAKLTALGAARVYPAASLRWKYAGELLPYFCQDLPHKVFEEAELVRAAFSLWADDRSRDEYLRQIRYRAWGDYGGLTAPDPEASYFLDSLYSLEPNEVFVDCGAYDGDTIRELLRRQGGAFGRIVAIEPDPGNFRSVERYVNALPRETAARIELHSCAVADRYGQVRFSANGDMGSAISKDEGIAIEAVPLDDLIHDTAPTFIKMDIEGAEVDALEGARTLIARHQPILSICLYHRQNDLWRIPLLIHSIHPGYRHFLRAHEEDGWQTVGYAIPPARLKCLSSGAQPAMEELCPTS